MPPTDPPAEPTARGEAADRRSRSALLPSRRTIAVVLGLATVFGVLAALQGNYLAARAGQESSFLESLKVWLPDYYLWAAFSPLIVALGRRWPLVRERWISNLSRHLVLGVAFALVELLLSCWIVAMLVADLPPADLGSFWDWYLRVIGVYSVWGLLIYLMILAAGQAYDLYQRLQEQELTSAELETRLAQAQLRALKMQLHPHFLFNTLHSVGVLVRKGAKERALEMLSRLAELLRQSLDNVDRHEVSLREELEFLHRYLEIEQVRFGDRLSVDFDVDPGAYDASVPNLLLQPLVENAIRHGVSPSASPRAVRVEATRSGESLVLRVIDDGPGLPPGWSQEEGEGVGLRNVRERLARLYGRDAELTVAPAEEGGVEARVRIPVRPASDGAATPAAEEEPVPLAGAEAAG